MKYIKLGSTGIDVSRICLGCMSYGSSTRGHMIGHSKKLRVGRLSSRHSMRASIFLTRRTSIHLVPVKKF